MQLKEVKEILNAEVICGEEFLGREIQTGCGSDMMSHVLANVSCDDVLLLTALTTPQTVYISDAVGILAICFVTGKFPDEETIELARERKMALLSTKWHNFTACGKLYQAGLRGCPEDDSE